MACVLDPRLILTHLNELGYQNISAAQLKEFMKDLKKLIKYDRNKRNLENTSPNLRHGTPKKNEISKSSERNEKDEVKCKKTLFTEEPTKVIEIKVHKGGSRVTQRSCDCYKKEVSNCVDRLQCNRTGTSETRSDSRIAKNTAAIPGQKSHKGGKVTFNKLSLKPKSSVIKTQVIKPTKSDPVALYQYYKQEWDKRLIPGENDHADLRWAIREKLLGEPRVVSSSTTRSRESLAKKRQELIR